MWEAVLAGSGKAAFSLLAAGVACVAWRVGLDAVKDNGVRRGLLGVVGASVFLAALAAGAVGQGVCVDGGDPLRGSCEAHDGGYAPAPGRAGAQFVYVFLLLTVPAFAGARAGKNRRR